MPRLGYWAVCLLVFAIPWENVLLVPGVGTITKVFGALALGVGTLVVLMRGRFRTPSLFLWLALFFMLYGCASLFWTIDRVLTLERIWKNVQLFIMLWLIWEATDTVQRRGGLMLVYVLGAWVSVLQTLERFHLGRGRVGGTRFAASVNFNPNDMGFLLCLGLPMAWHLGVHHPKVWVRWICRAYIPAGLFTVFITGSRSGLIVAMVALLLVPWTLPRLPVRLKAVTMVIMLAAAVVAVLYVPERSWERLSTTGQQIESGNLNDRVWIWTAGFKVFPEHPIIGVGGGAFSTAVGPYLGEDRAAHNTYLSILIDQGLVGELFFLVLLFVSWLHARNAPIQERKLLIVLWMTLGIGLLPRAWEDKKATWLLFGMLNATAAGGVSALAPSSQRAAREITVRRPAVRGAA